jgi:hypothetical protein
MIQHENHLRRRAVLLLERHGITWHSRLFVLGAFAFTLLASLVHVACTTASEVDSGASELNDNAASGSGYGYGYGYDNAAANVAPDQSD